MKTNLLDRIDRVEAVLISVVAKVTPWGAPIPTAYLVGRAVMRHLGFPQWVALVAALVIEGLGLATTATALRLWNYNRDRRRKTDPEAPEFLASVLVVVYLSTAILLTVLLDARPDLVSWAPIMFPFLSMTGMLVLALHADHARRLEVVRARDNKPRASAAEPSADARVARAAEQILRRMGLPVNDGNLPESKRQFSGMVRQGHIELPEDITGAELATAFPAVKNERTGRNWLKDARNGH